MKRHRTRRIHQRHRGKPSYFFIKANICLGVVICTLALASMENDTVKTFCGKASDLLSTTTDTSELVLGKDRLKGMLLSGEGTDGVTYTLSEEIKAEIAERTYTGYKNKGAPQSN